MNISAIQQAVFSLTKGRITVLNGKPNNISLHGKPVNYHEVQRLIARLKEFVGENITINLDDVLQKLRKEISQDTQSTTSANKDSSFFIG